MACIACDRCTSISGPVLGRRGGGSHGPEASAAPQPRKPIGDGGGDSPLSLARCRDENIGLRAGCSGANCAKPKRTGMSSYTASMPPRMKYASCQKPVPREFRRKSCYRSRCGVERDQASSASKSSQYWRMPRCRDQRHDKILMEQQPIGLFTNGR
jgi:hypothetical protein